MLDLYCVALAIDLKETPKLRDHFSVSMTGFQRRYLIISAEFILLRRIFRLSQIEDNDACASDVDLAQLHFQIFGCLEGRIFCYDLLQKKKISVRKLGAHSARMIKHFHSHNLLNINENLLTSRLARKLSVSCLSNLTYCVDGVCWEKFTKIASPLDDSQLKIGTSTSTADMLSKNVFNKNIRYWNSCTGFLRDRYVTSFYLGKESN